MRDRSGIIGLVVFLNGVGLLAAGVLMAILIDSLNILPENHSPVGGTLTLSNEQEVYHLVSTSPVDMMALNCWGPMSLNGNVTSREATAEESFGRCETGGSIPHVIVAQIAPGPFSVQGEHTEQLFFRGPQLFAIRYSPDVLVLDYVIVGAAVILLVLAAVFLNKFVYKELA